MIWPFRRPGYGVLVLCTANICRSPVAAALLAAQLRRCGLHRRIAVSSAGVAVASPGSPPDPRMVALASARGLRLRGHRARPLGPECLAGVELVLGMEHEHLEACATQFPDWRGSLELFDPAGLEIGDPFFGSRADVRDAFEHLDRASVARAEAWSETP